jgi:hypothetical protein
LKIVWGIISKPVMEHETTVREYFEAVSKTYILDEVNTFVFANTMGIYIRLGDLPDIWRRDIDWCISKIQQIKEKSSNE